MWCWVSVNNTKIAFFIQKSNIGWKKWVFTLFWGKLKSWWLQKLEDRSHVSHDITSWQCWRLTKSDLKVNKKSDRGGWQRVKQTQFLSYAGFFYIRTFFKALISSVLQKIVFFICYFELLSSLTLLHHWHLPHFLSSKPQ